MGQNAARLREALRTDRQVAKAIPSSLAYRQVGLAPKPRYVSYTNVVNNAARTMTMLRTLALLLATLSPRDTKATQKSLPLPSRIPNKII